MTKDEELARLAAGEGPLAKSAGDEPVFILVARDPLAAIIVNLWAAMCDLPPHGPNAKAHEARELSRKMLQWGRERWDRMKEWPD